MSENGFELNGVFYRWSVGDTGKDLMLIDRFAGMPLWEFFELVDDGFDRGRAPILLTMLATSIRAGQPDWSVERITRTVMDVHLSELVFVDADEDAEVPPTSTPGEPTGGNSASLSRSEPSDPSPATYATSNATPA